MADEEIVEREIDWSKGDGGTKCPKRRGDSTWVTGCMACARFRMFKFKSNHDWADGTEFRVVRPTAIFVGSPYHAAEHGELATHVRCATPKPTTCLACKQGTFLVTAEVVLSNGRVCTAECKNCGREIPIE